MLDLALNTTNGSFDIDITDGDITAVNNFQTAILVSLFSDSRANESQVFIPENRRGWIGDLTTPIPDQKFGSLLWLVEQERLTQSILNRAIDFARNALQWLIDQQIAVTVTVTGEIVPQRGIALNIEIVSLSGVTESHYVELWENTINVN